MRRVILFIIIVIANSYLAYTQPILKPQVIATAGNSGSAGNYHLSYTIGQVIAFTGQAPNTILTQGFQQPGVCMPYQNEEICIVLVDSTIGKNLIVWEKTPNVGTEYFNVYKETAQTGVYAIIGTVSYDSLTIFTDMTSSPMVHSDRYKISVVDTCDIESALSPHHRTLHLSVTENGMGNGYILDWQDSYEGFTFYTYRIFRGSSLSTLVQIDSIQSTLSSYTDTTTLSGTLYYVITAVKPGDPCDPENAKAQGGPYSQSFSNLDDNITVHENNISDKTNEIIIYPNPAKDEIVIETLRNIDKNGITCEIMSPDGQIIRKLKINNPKIKIDISEINSGFYIIRVKSDNEITIKKLIKQ